MPGLARGLSALGHARSRLSSYTAVSAEDVMALLTQHDTPDSLRDLPPGSALYTNWHNYIAGKLLPSTPGTGGGEFYDAFDTDVNPIGERSLVWMGFPRRVLMPNRDNRTAAFTNADRTAAGDFGNRAVQDEYFEWRVTRNAAGKITRVVFTTETPEYWEAIAAVDRPALVGLYQALVSPAVVEADLFLNAPPAAWIPIFTDGSGQFYDRRNRWNTDDGIAHLMQSINTLDAALGLAQGSAVTPTAPVSIVSPAATARDGYEMPPIANTSVDPRVKFDVGTLVRKGLSVTLREPIGLYIAGFDDTGWTKPSGAPVDDYWRIVRGSPGRVLRLEYHVPAGSGFVVGDLRIGGRRIEWGGQIAEHITVTIAGIAGLRAR